MHSAINNAQICTKFENLLMWIKIVKIFVDVLDVPFSETVKK